MHSGVGSGVAVYCAAGLGADCEPSEASFLDELVESAALKGTVTAAIFLSLSLISDFRIIYGF